MFSALPVRPYTVRHSISIPLTDTIWQLTQNILLNIVTLRNKVLSSDLTVEMIRPIRGNPLNRQLNR
jgi:hypothetical protein